MKNLFKVAVVAVLSLGFGVAANAQDRSAEIAASAKVVDALSVTPDQDLNFGIVMQGVKKMVSVSGGTSDLDGGEDNTTGVTVGKFLVNAGAGSSVTLSFIVPSNLKNGTIDLPILFNQGLDGQPAVTVAYGATSGSVTGLSVSADNSITFPSTPIGEGTAAKNGTYVWIGGVVNPSGNQANGSYTGTVTLTASYN
jgi:hypothetical protein